MVKPMLFPVQYIKSKTWQINLQNLQKLTFLVCGQAQHGLGFFRSLFFEDVEHPLPSLICKIGESMYNYLVINIHQTLVISTTSFHI